MTTKDQSKLRIKFTSLNGLIAELHDGKFSLGGMQKVTLAYPEKGMSDDTRLLDENKILDNVVYHIKTIDIHGFYTHIELVERPGVWFNGCTFELA